MIIVKIKVNDSEKKGGLFSLGSTGEPKERLIYLILSEEDHELTRVEIETEKGEFDTSLENGFIPLANINVAPPRVFLI